CATSYRGEKRDKELKQSATKRQQAPVCMGMLNSEKNPNLERFFMKFFLKFFPYSEREPAFCAKNAWRQRK
ncbi:hypothetical protein, partial [Desulfovibrio piger]|uniref:hypothetical protein n=1 Tax=Desulfovibrio piger TaxID=901 RepID=UPI0026EB75DA